MKTLLDVAVKVLQLFSLGVTLLVVLLLVLLYNRGLFQPKRWEHVLQFLRGGEMPTGRGNEIIKGGEDQSAASLEQKWLQFQAATAERDRVFQQKEEALSKRAELLQLEQADLEKQRQALNERLAKIKQQETAPLPKEQATEEEHNFQSNLAIFGKMESADVAARLKAWDDKTIRKYLQALKPAKASEIVRLLAQDPSFSSPPGKSRLDAILLGDRAKQ